MQSSGEACQMPPQVSDGTRNRNLRLLLAVLCPLSYTEPVRRHRTRQATGDSRQQKPSGGPGR